MTIPNDRTAYPTNVRYWHKTDMPCALHMSAFGGKADTWFTGPTARAKNFLIIGERVLQSRGQLDGVASP